MTVIAYTYEADTHCPRCTAKRFGPECEGIDREGNEVHAMHSWEEGQLDDEGYALSVVCGDCNGVIRGGYRGSYSD